MTQGLVRAMDKGSVKGGTGRKIPATYVSGSIMEPLVFSSVATNYLGAVKKSLPVSDPANVVLILRDHILELHQKLDQMFMVLEGLSRSAEGCFNCSWCVVSENEKLMVIGAESSQ